MTLQLAERAAARDLSGRRVAGRVRLQNRIVRDSLVDNPVCRLGLSVVSGLMGV
jgi:hypothetical protein